MRKHKGKGIQQTVHYYEDGQLVKIVGRDQFEDFYDERVSQLKKEGYTFLREKMGENAVFVNYKTQKCIFLAHKTWLGFYDCEGNKIFHGDTLRLKDSRRLCSLCDDEEGNWHLTIHYNSRYNVEVTGSNTLKNLGVIVTEKVF